jgi:hypothetical protein
MNPNPNLILFGGHCKSSIDVIEAKDKFTIAGILDVAEKKVHETFGQKFKFVPSNNNLISHCTTRVM